MRIAILLLLASLLLSSCHTAKWWAEHRPSNDTIKETVYQRYDSIVERVVEVPQPADSSMVQYLIECDSSRRAILKQLTDMRAGQHLNAPILTLSNNILTATCEVDSFSVYAIYKDRYHMSQLTTNTNTRTTYTAVGDKPIPFIPKVFMWIGIIFVCYQLIKYIIQWKNKR